MLKEEYNEELCKFYEGVTGSELNEADKVYLTKLYHQFNNFNGTIVSARRSSKTWIARIAQVFVLYDMIGKEK